MQLLDDGVVGGHALHAKGQYHGKDGGQAFRYGGHSQRNGEQQGINHVVDVVEALEHGERYQYHDGDDAHRNTQNLGDIIHLLLQRSFLVFGGGKHVGNLTDLCVHAGAGHDGTACALRDGCAVEDHIGAVAKGLRFGERIRLLTDWHGFAGQGGFGNAQAGRVDQSSIGRDRVAFGKDDDVAGNHVGGVDAQHLAATQHRGLRSCHLGERLNGGFCLGFLHIAEHGVDNQDEDDYEGVERQRFAAFCAGTRIGFLDAPCND